MKGRVLLGAAGLVLMAWGMRGMLVDAELTAPIGTLTWLAGALVAHDFLLAPLVCAVGWLLTRLLPAEVRPPVQGGLFVIGVVALLAWPLVATPAPQVNPTNVGLDTGRLGVLLGLVAAGTALAVVRARMRAGAARRRDTQQSSGPGPSNRPST